jgi:hypothetical protein
MLDPVGYYHCTFGSGLRKLQELEELLSAGRDDEDEEDEDTSCKKVNRETLRKNKTKKATPNPAKIQYQASLDQLKVYVSDLFDDLERQIQYNEEQSSLLNNFANILNDFETDFEYDLESLSRFDDVPPDHCLDLLQESFQKLNDNWLEEQRRLNSLLEEEEEGCYSDYQGSDELCSDILHNVWSWIQQYKFENRY